MKTERLFTILEEAAPLALAAPWDNCGVQVAGSAPEVTRLAVALDPRPATVAACLDSGAQCILTHHPLYLSPKAPKAEDDYLRVLRLVLQRGAWLYAAHTCLDAAPDGPAFWLGRELGLTGGRTLQPCPGYEDVAATGARVPGFGEAGELPGPLSVPELADRISALTGRSVIQIIGPRPETVRTVAYCGGSGGDLISRAASLGAQAYVTGDVKYHQALEARTLVFDVGHFSLEEEMVRRLALDLAARLGPEGVEVRFFPGADPYEAYPGARA